MRSTKKPAIFRPEVDAFGLFAGRHGTMGDRSERGTFSNSVEISGVMYYTYRL